MEQGSRRVVAGVIRFVLVIMAMGIVAFWIYRRLPERGHVSLRSQAPPVDSLGQGDLRIYNADSSIDMILQGDRVLAGLSEKSIAEIRAKLDSGEKKDTDLGGNIAQLVKGTIAGAIGTHAAFPLSDIRDIRYDKGQMVFDWNKGVSHRIFGNIEVDKKKVSNSFREADAEAFIAAFRARKVQLGQTP